MNSTARMVAGLIGTGMLAAASAQAQDDQLNFIFVHHAAPGHQFWEIEKNGMEEACALIDADCQMVFLQTQDGNIGEVLQNLEAAIEQRPDGIATTIMDPEAFDESIQRAIDMGIPVVSYNVDDKDGAMGSARMGYMGSNLIKAGYTLGLGISKFFPEEGPIHVLIGTNDPGQQWSQERTLGAEMFMEEYAAANPDREITWDNIDAGYDLGVTGARVSAYIQTHPNTTAYLDNGFWEVGVARAPARSRLRARSDPARRLRPQHLQARRDEGELDPGHGGPAALPAGVPVRDAALPPQQVRAGALERRHGRVDRHPGERRHGARALGPEQALNATRRLADGTEKGPRAPRPGAGAVRRSRFGGAAARRRRAGVVPGPP